MKKNRFISWFIFLGIIFFIVSCGTTRYPEGMEEISTEDKERKEFKDSDAEMRKKSEDVEKEPAASLPPKTPMEKEDLSFDSAPAPPPSASPAPLKPIPSASGLKAGYADDNKQFNYFLNFLDEFSERLEKYYYMNIRERIILKLQDNQGKSIPNADVKIYDGTHVVTHGKSFSDGTFLFFPSQYDQKTDSFRADVNYMQNYKEVKIDRNGKREIEIIFDQKRAEMETIAADILFILDTTGSMGEEIEQLKTTIELIHLNLSSMAENVKVRFGMVLYRDKEDDYVTKIVPLTDDLEKFQSVLNEVYADGGGDMPEDLQSALEDAMKKIEWNENAVKLSFIITDASAHLDYGQDYTYVDAAADAKESGIKIFSVGTGGLDISGEYILRQISQYTSGKYIFLTYGESGESDGGKIGSVSHHTGENFQTDKLEAIIIRFAKEELSYLTDKPLAMGDEFFEARKIIDEAKEATLNQLFDMSISQLIDYSTYRIQQETPAAVLPIVATEEELTDAEYFAEQLSLAISKKRFFRMIERRELEKIMDELAIQMSGFVEEENAVKVGDGLGAEILISGRLYPKPEKYELFLKLLRVETGEVLSVTKLKIDKDLGLLGN